MTRPFRRKFPIVTRVVLNHGVIVGMYPSGDPTFGVELQRQNPSSTAWNTIYQVEEIGRQNEIRHTDFLPNDGRERSYRARHVKTGWTAGTWTDTAIGTPAEMPTGEPPPPDETNDGRSTEIILRVNRQIIAEQMEVNSTASLGARARNFYVFDGTTGAGAAWLNVKLTGMQYFNGVGISLQQLEFANAAIRLGSTGSGPASPVVTQIQGALANRVVLTTETTYTLDSNDMVLGVSASGNATVTLPSLPAGASRHMYKIVNRSTAYTITVNRGSTLDSIDGSSDLAIGVRPGSATLQAPSTGGSGGDWWVTNLYD